MVLQSVFISSLYRYLSDLQLAYNYSQTLINDFYISTLEILESDWLISDLTISDRRSIEMASIRQLIIPHLIMRLHFALYESGSIIPR